ncbi:MAG: hypothetical protein PHU97_04430 [Bacteroidales bacterium]|nr:hypothetical protein [Bacteroidales bacterium]HPE87047.1 hypothetical protein [Bacteroidales bacterium]
MEDATMTTTTTINLFPSPQTRQEKYLTGHFNNDNNDNLLSLPLSRDPSGEIPDGSTGPSTTTTRQQNFGNTNTT